MKKRITIFAVVFILVGIFSSCNTGGTGTANAGPFSGAGGWKAEEGAVLILDEGGTGITLSELKYEGENIPDYLPRVYKSDVKWEEDAETVILRVAGAEYPYAKKKEGDNEILEVNGISFARLSEDELKEYREKAETAAPLPTSQTDTSAAGTTEENQKIEFTDKILLDNEYMTVELTQFFEKKVNWAGREPQIEKYLTLKVHNNSDKEYLFNLQDAYIKDESVTAVMQDGNSGPAPGKTKTYSYDIYYNTSPDPTALDSLEDLYTLDAEIQISISDGDKYIGREEYRININDAVNGTVQTASVDNNGGSVDKETDYMTIEGVYVDNSYSTKDNENMRFLYIFYTAHTKDQNLKIDSKSMNLKINDSNTYKAVRSKRESRYLRNYYNGAYLKDVYVGEEVKFVETFEVPEGDLEAGRNISISKSQIPDADKIRLTTDDIIFCDSPEEVAEKADPEGYDEEMWALEDADGEVAAAVKEEINGYQWDVNVNNMKYQIEFWEPNEYELRTSFNTSGGTYEVKNGYIICTNDIDGKIEIPFTYEDGEVKVDVISAFDFYK